MPTGENRNTGRKTSSSATFSTTNLTWTYLGPNSGLRVERPSANRLIHDTAFRSQILPSLAVRTVLWKMGLGCTVVLLTSLVEVPR